jgi:hypothetical protein
MVQIRFPQEVGYLKQDIGSSANAIRFLVGLRGQGLGLSYNINDKDQIIWVRSLNDYCQLLNQLNNIRS